MKGREERGSPKGRAERRKKWFEGRQKRARRQRLITVVDDAFANDSWERGFNSLLSSIK